MTTWCPFCGISGDHEWLTCAGCGRKTLDCQAIESRFDAGVYYCRQCADERGMGEKREWVT